MIKFDFKTFNNVKDTSDYKNKIHDIRKTFDSKKDMLDWYDVDTCITENEVKRIKKVGKYIRNNADVLIVVGAGGAYLGSKAVIEMFKEYFGNNKLEIIYTGNNLSSDYLKSLLEYVMEKEIVLNVISKSGNTIETNLIFDVLLELMEAKYDENELKKRVIITTDRKEGRLRKLAKENGFVTFPTKKNIASRFSIMTTIGLLPICAFGIDTDKLIKGYESGKKYIEKAYVYSVMRDVLYNKGKKVESFAVYEPKLSYFTEWLKYLFSETQGKNNKGILPVSTINSRDLHTMGQFYQEGDPIIFETVINIASNDDIKINEKPLSKINHLMLLSVAKARKTHTPTNIITISKINEKNVGELIYFFMVSAAIGGYLLDVNPFNQPGVNRYKKLLIDRIGEI